METLLYYIKNINASKWVIAVCSNITTYKHSTSKAIWITHRIKHNTNSQCCKKLNNTLYALYKGLSLSKWHLGSKCSCNKDISKENTFPFTVALRCITWSLVETFYSSTKLLRDHELCTSALPWFQAFVEAGVAPVWKHTFRKFSDPSR